MAIQSWTLLLACLLFDSFEICQARTFVIDKANRRFLKDNQPFKFISGSIHYFRVPRAYWKDRLYKMRMAGLNTIASFVEWRGHEPQPGKFHFLDNYDVVEFCKEAQRQDLLVILRVGPYIGGHIDNGGLPSWLLKKSNIIIRSKDETFMGAMEKWLDRLLPTIKATLYKNGGPVIALQFENQRGQIAVDEEYLTGLYNILRKHVGDDVILFTNDYFGDSTLDKGGVKGVPKATCMHSTDSVQSIVGAMNFANPQGSPVIVIELHVTCFGGWGLKRLKPKIYHLISAFKALMDVNASVNIYMFHGGTNFGFSAGSDVGRFFFTSFDNYTPLSEAGDPTDLYYTLRNATKEFVPLPKGNTYGSDVAVASSPKLNIGSVKLTQGASLMEVMDHFRTNGWLKSRTHSYPITFENMGQDYGFLLYTSKASTAGSTLYASDIEDRGYVVTKESRSVLDAGTSQASIKIEKGETLAIFVENCGREFRHRQDNGKGIKGYVQLDNTNVEGWTTEAVPVVENRDVSRVMQYIENKSSPAVPGFFHGTFTLPSGQGPVGDTFLDPTGWTKGIAFINGINLGRYWPKKGPQVTLYLPGAFMLPHPEENRLFLLEMEGAPNDRTVKLVDKHVLDGPVQEAED